MPNSYVFSQQFCIPGLLHKCSRQLIIHKETSYAITQNVTSASMFIIWNLEMLSPDITANVRLVTLFYDKNILVAKAYAADDYAYCHKYYEIGQYFILLH